MKLIDHATATVDLEFTEGNPGTGTPATRVTAQWLNVLQEEIANVVEGAGDTLDQTGVNRSQLFDAIETLIAGAAATYASDAEAFAGTVNNKSLTPSNFGTKSFSGSGYQKLPGGLILQWGLVTPSGGNATITFPIAFPNACRICVATCQDTTASGEVCTTSDITETNFRLTSYASTNGIASPFVTSYFALGN